MSPLFEVLVKRIIIHWGLLWGPLLLGTPKYHLTEIVRPLTQVHSGAARPGVSVSSTTATIIFVGYHAFVVWYDLVWYGIV